MLWRRLAWALVFFFIIQTGLWLLLKHNHKHFVLDGGTTVDQHIATQVALDHSQVLLIGNSFLGEGVDVDQLSGLTQTSITKGAIPGSTLPTWFLVLKNVVAPMEQPPRKVVLFFVDSHATWPDYNMDGNYHLIRRYALQDEPVLAQRLFYDRSSIVEVAVTNTVASYRFRHDVQKDIYWFASYWLGSMLGLDWETINHGENVWSDSELRNAELETSSQLAQWPAEHLDFDRELPHSLLPEILEIAHGQQIQLIFVRMPRRRDYRQAQPVALVEYMEDLRSYLETHDAVLLDFSAAPQINESYFGVGDHLNENGRAVFTELLGVELRPILQVP